jgi:hypothetical protein
MEIITAVSGWYWILSLLAAVLYAGLLYRHDQVAYPAKGWKWAAATFRALVVALIVLLLINPYLKTEQKITEKPLVLLLSDNSSSLEKTSSADKNKLKIGWETLSNQLADKSRLRKLHFGDALKDAHPLSYTDQATDLSRVFQEISSRFGSQPIGAIVMATDGIYNRGANPLYMAEQLGVPVYSISLGDTQMYQDALIREVRANSLVFKGREFPILVGLEAHKLVGEQAEIQLFDITNGQNRLLNKQIWAIQQTHVFDEVRFTTVAEQAGIRKYRVVVKHKGVDVNLANNSRDFYIEVIDDETRILLLAASPHPDMSTIRQALESAPQYKVDVRFANDPIQLEETPDLVILHQFPTTTSSPWLSMLEEKKWPTWFVVGSQTSFPAFNKMQNQLQINARPGNSNPVMANLQPGFQLFSLEAGDLRDLQSFPPLEAPFGTFQQAINLNVLLKQRIGSVATDFPLWAFNTNSRPRLAFTLAEGMWRWRLAQAEDKLTTDPLGDLIRKTVAYLAVKEDKRNFRANSSRKLYNEQEELVFEAELYDANYQPVTEPDVALQIKATSGKEYSFSFGRSDSKYRLNAGSLPPGDYSFTAQCQYNGKNEVARGAFSIAQLNLEALQGRADHQLLAQIADISGGAVFSLADMAKIPDLLLQKEALVPIAYYEQQVSDLINLKWILFLLFGLLAFEWFIRRYSGAY